MKIPASLKEYGLDSPNDFGDDNNLVMSSEAETGCGKSDLILRSAPEPILVIDLDRNLNKVARKYKHRDILIKPVSIPPVFDRKYKENQSRDYKILMDVQDLFIDALESGEFETGTIFIDTFDALYELARRGILGGGMQFNDPNVKRPDYSAVNAFMRQFFDEAKRRRINFCASAHMGDDFKREGRRTARGWKQTTQCSECHIRLYKNDDVKGLDKFNLEIIKSTVNSFAEGTILQGEEISWKTLQDTIFEG